MAKKTVNSDIYNLSQLVDDVKSEFIPDETEETLAISTFGYIGALESSRLQTQVQMTGELCNEVFPSRARLDRNVITHAIMANIENILFFIFLVLPCIFHIDHIKLFYSYLLQYHISFQYFGLF